ncbi:GNAT family N-acetyltransferase [Streptomyces sp. VRA16 Mangrove soil]|uniref:GNAT family N-acetyltransferase n=1 Tax=Streptomyces sp. VRA16 Mangrove soil TaxID=2817434 RepID=UPI001A9CFD37|nr:GNAT family N-acetyltransferase [Streptomyces sp. VRA16 Mangrove soil]MBO1330614.1 GNAT family N-acetyltransferase [Streptomyces sp. VRA16 Mangrove soil]
MNAPSVHFRDLPESDIERALSLAYLVFHESPESDKRRHHEKLLTTCMRIGAYEGDALVGFAAAHPFTLSVPGGRELPCPGLTFVSVAPTHRRRGLLSGMIDELFARCGREGAPMVALWASEASIYGRFGFGPGTYGATVEIDARRPLALRLSPDPRPLRLVDAAAAPALLAPYFERTRAVRAGRLARTRDWWCEEWLAEKDEEDEELSPPRVVALGEPLAGYAIYRTKSGDASTRRRGSVRVDDLEADSPQVAAALWSYLVSIDLTDQVRAWGRPLDDPLMLFAADRDQVRVTEEFPALWVRLVDVRAALAARSWAAPVDVVLEVRDERLPGNAGTFRLIASPDGFSYAPASDAPDLSLEVRDLASVHMGAVSVRALVAAGLVAEHTPGAAAMLDAALAVGLLPHTVDAF